MTLTAPTVDSHLVLAKAELDRVIQALIGQGYRVIGPRVRDSAIVLDELTGLHDLPKGTIDEQDGGRYRLVSDARAGYFDHVVGPHSVKNYLFPPREVILEGLKQDGSWVFRGTAEPARPLAVLGLRGCDLAGLRIQDRVFLSGPYVDPHYASRRENLLVIAVNCRRAAATCFCHSMETGPGVTSSYDLALTETDAYFLVHVGTSRGADLLLGIAWRPATSAEIDQGRESTQHLHAAMDQRSQLPTTSLPSHTPRPRWLDTQGLHDLLLNQLDHPRWTEVAQRCLACTNCTLVCPTCFCSSIQEVPDLLGDHVQRERHWSSCFTAEHSTMNSGTVRSSIRARYRQWLTHKLATWIDQFGESGCVGCGRCITWCPVGIDLTEEVAAIRHSTPVQPVDDALSSSAGGPAS